MSIAQSEAVGELVVWQRVGELLGQKILYCMDDRVVVIAVAKLHVKRRVASHPAKLDHVFTRDTDGCSRTQITCDQVKRKINAR